ncbi:hypothetical protein K0M31_016092 [Melipona bicolor]|uniref:Uncharacterized protein n=1 Tax=Melipona bicolor TaxID=60889 RepID=A0AA40G6E2_9HYME|nr:hypothetical protein K0M31_016092 [Melipona bicolor]
MNGRWEVVEKESQLRLMRFKECISSRSHCLDSSVGLMAARLLTPDACYCNYPLRLARYHPHPRIRKENQTDIKTKKTKQKIKPDPKQHKENETKIEQPKKQTQNTKTPTYEELTEINKKLNQKIENLEKRMKEIIKLHNRYQEGTSTENKEEKMDIEENEKEKKNTQPWITIPSPKKKNEKINQRTTNQQKNQGPVKNHQHYHTSRQNT